MKPEWILVAVFGEIEEDSNLLSVEVTDALNFGGYGTGARAQIRTENLKRMPDSVDSDDGRTLNVVLKGRLLLCYRCGTWGKMRGNYP